MTPNEYLDALKAEIAVESDYALAARLDIPRQRIHDMRNGARPVDNAVAFKIAIALKLDPASVVADLESQREKNPKRQAFWAGFLGRVAMSAVLVCTLALPFTASFENGAAAIGGAVAFSALARRRSMRTISSYEQQKAGESRFFYERIRVASVIPNFLGITHLENCGMRELVRGSRFA